MLLAFECEDNEKRENSGLAKKKRDPRRRRRFVRKQVAKEQDEVGAPRENMPPKNSGRAAVFRGLQQQQRGSVP